MHGSNTGGFVGVRVAGGEDGRRGIVAGGRGRGGRGRGRGQGRGRARDRGDRGGGRQSNSNNPANESDHDMNNDAESQDDMMGLMDEDELDPEMRDTLRARLAKKTRKSYEDTLTRFFRFLFDNLDDHQGIFQENFLLCLGVAAAEDSK